MQPVRAILDVAWPSGNELSLEVGGLVTGAPSRIVGLKEDLLAAAHNGVDSVAVAVGGG